MPVRSLHSSVLKWPDKDTVVQAATEWARREADHRTDLVRLGYFGSYATGNWGVGSDLDLVAVVKTSAEPFLSRALGWDLGDLPVPAEILIYTASEWGRVVARQDRFAKVMTTEVVWLYS